MKVKEESKTACQGEKLDIDCGDEYIDVTFANYGRLSSKVCMPGEGADSEVKSTNCIHPASLKVIQKKCQGKKKCDGIKVSTHTFEKGDKLLCPGTLKYLEVRFRENLAAG